MPHRPPTSEADWIASCARRLGNVITALDLTKAEAARQMRIDPSKLGHWLAGRHRADAYILDPWLYAHGISWDYITRGDVRLLSLVLADRLALAERERNNPE